MNQIKAINPLHHGFLQVTVALETPVQALPGQYVIVNGKYPLYIMGQALYTYHLLFPPMLAHLLQEPSSLHLSDIQGVALKKPESNKFYLMTVEDDALSACVFYFKTYRALFNGLVFIGTQTVFPFSPCPSRQLIEGVPPDVIAAIPLLEDWHVPHRLASLQPIPGCFEGNVHTLALKWQQQQSRDNIVILPLKSLLHEVIHSRF